VWAVDDRGVFEQAGVQRLDTLVSWHRPANLLTGSSPAHGQIESFFDWLWLEINQLPRGHTVLHGLRSGKPVNFSLDIEPGSTEIRPRMPKDAAETFSKGLSLIEAGQVSRVANSWREVAQTENKKYSWHLRCWILFRIAQQLSEAELYSEAEEAYLDALEIARNPVSRVAIFDVLGDVYLQKGELESALRAFHSALDISESTWGESLGVAHSKSRLGEVYWLLDEFDRAEKFDNSALEIRTRLAPTGNLALDLKNLGREAHRAGNLESAENYYSRALEVFTSGSYQGHDVAETMEILGYLYEEQWKLKELSRRRG